MEEMNTSSPPVTQSHFVRPGQSENASTPVMVQAPKSGHSYLDRVQLTSMKATSTTQLICGLLAITFEAIHITTTRTYGVGIWSGVFYLSAGILGLVAASQNKKSLLIATLVLSLLSLSMLFILIGLTGSDIKYCEGTYYYGFKPPCNIGDFVIGCFMMIISVIELIASIWASLVCCKALCAAGTMRSMCCSTCTGQGVCCCTTEPVYYAWRPDTGSQINSEQPIMDAASRQYPAPAAAPPVMYQVFYPGAAQPPAMSTTNYAASARGQNLEAA